MFADEHANACISSKFDRMGISTYKKILGYILYFILISLNSISYAEETYLQVNGASVHSKSGYNGFNPGLGLEREVSENWNIAGGWYFNSNYQGSAYLYGRYSYFRSGSWDLGVGLGGATGYKNWGIMPIAFPEFCYGYLCLVALPQLEATGASILAIHARIPL
jgi:hypothetical protein